MTLLFQFFYLQALDVLTTLAFLGNGAREANPLVRFMMTVGPTPLAGLVALKLGAVALAFCCWRWGRLRLLGRLNVFYAALVAWNLVAVVLSAPVFAS
jgi:hypothetical protein